MLLELIYERLSNNIYRFDKSSRNKSYLILPCVDLRERNKFRSLSVQDGFVLELGYLVDCGRNPITLINTILLLLYYLFRWNPLMTMIHATFLLIDYIFSQIKRFQTQHIVPPFIFYLHHGKFFTIRTFVAKIGTSLKISFFIIGFII